MAIQYTQSLGFLDERLVKVSKFQQDRFMMILRMNFLVRFSNIQYFKLHGRHRC